MITVLCANPALDVTYTVDRVTRGAVHAVTSVRRRAGGKGANTARVLHQLGESATLVVPLGGAAGEQYAAEIVAAGLHLEQVTVGASPRTSVCVVDGDATVFNERGPMLSPAEWECVVAATLATRPRVLVVAGSLPAGVPDDAYADLIDATDAITVVDAKGAELSATLAARPDVVAPNLSEAQQIVDGHDARSAGAALCAMGARAAVVSTGADGLVALTEHGSWRARPPRVLTGNPTGAGDAVTAAIARGLHAGAPWPDLLRDAVATSGATLACATAGCFDAALRVELLDGVRIEEASDAAHHHR